MDILCFSHLRWNFVFQRPQHLFTRCANNFRVFYIEEPTFSDQSAKLNVDVINENIVVVVPSLPHGLSPKEQLEEQSSLLQMLFDSYEIKNYIAWFYTPMALPLIDELPEPACIVYDCMDELSNFKFAPVELQTREKELLRRADLVFTGGHSLFEFKKNLHHNIHPFPSSIDKEHFGKARNMKEHPEEQAKLNGPLIGFYGVIDERMDIDLLRAIATSQPSWNIVLIGPIVKIDPSELPQLPNIHHLGSRDYNALPQYLAGWDVAMIPFAINKSTEFISPTKTPEYLAGGVPVVSTAITDVINPYEKSGLVYIGRDHDEFIDGIARSLSLKKSPVWRSAVDLFLKDLSWDNTWEKMSCHLNKVLSSRHSTHSYSKKLNGHV